MNISRKEVLRTIALLNLMRVEGRPHLDEFDTEAFGRVNHTLQRLLDKT